MCRCDIINKYKEKRKWKGRDHLTVNPYKDKKNPYKNSLKCTPNVNPKSPNVKITEDADNIYLTLGKGIQNKYDLTFCIPKKPRDISAYLQSPSHDKLKKRYATYSSKYKQLIFEEIKKQRAYINEKLPSLPFLTKIRQKSPYSYEDKVNGALLNNKDGLINDIIATRYIFGYDYANLDPQDERNLCKSITQEVITTLTNFSDLPDSNFYVIKTKDYITHPETAKSNQARNSSDENMYKSVHLIFQHKTIPDCTFEIQLRTMDMEHIAKYDSSVGHQSYKPTYLTEDTLSYVPTYYCILQNPETKQDVFFEISLEDAFRNVNSVDVKNANGEIISCNITLEEYQNALEQLKPYIEKQKQKEKLRETEIAL